MVLSCRYGRAVDGREGGGEERALSVCPFTAPHYVGVSICFTCVKDTREKREEKDSERRGRDLGVVVSFPT